MSNVILSDTTLCGVGSFLLAARKYEKIKAIVGFRYTGKTYLALDSGKLMELFDLYSKKRFERLSAFPSIVARQLRYIPGVEIQLEAFKVMCEYLGVKLDDEDSDVAFIDIEDESIVNQISNFTGYTLTSKQRLPSAKGDFLSELLLNESEYPERLQKEVRVINSRNFANYFYTIKTIVDLARRNDIEIGPGGERRR